MTNLTPGSQFLPLTHYLVTSLTFLHYLLFKFKILIQLKLFLICEIWLRLQVSPHECGEGNGTPLQYSCLENPMDGGAW